jgi:hypothetical protein
MTKAISTFALVAILTAALAAASLFATQKGYPQGAIGLSRLGDIANAATFIPLAAIYALSGALLMILPLRAASFVLVSATDALFWTAVALLAAIVGVVLARAAFGQTVAPLWALADWRFAFALAVIGCHAILNALRQNVLLRSIGFAAFIAATLLCLYWTFRF